MLVYLWIIIHGYGATAVHIHRAPFDTREQCETALAQSHADVSNGAESEYVVVRLCAPKLSTALLQNKSYDKWTNN